MAAAIKNQSDSDDVPETACAPLRKLIQDESGQDLIEYALIFSFVALGAIAATKSLTANIINVFAAVGSTLTSAT